MIRHSIINYNVHDLYPAVNKKTVFDVHKYDFKPRPWSKHPSEDFDKASEVYYTYAGLVICLKHSLDSRKRGQIKEL